MIAKLGGKKPLPQNAAPSPWRWLEVRRVSRRAVASLAESHTWLASSEERRSLAKISNLAVVAFTKVSIWLEDRSCLCVRMCACVCVHASDLGRADCASPSLPGPTPQSLSEMKDDGSTEAERQRRILAGSFFLWEQTHTQLAKTKGCDIQYGRAHQHFFLLQNLSFKSLHWTEREREREETKSEGLISRKSFI